MPIYASEEDTIILERQIRDLDQTFEAVDCPRA